MSPSAASTWWPLTPRRDGDSAPPRAAPPSFSTEKSSLISNLNFPRPLSSHPKITRALLPWCPTCLGASHLSWFPSSFPALGRSFENSAPFPAFPIPGVSLPALLASQRFSLSLGSSDGERWEELGIQECSHGLDFSLILTLGKLRHGWSRGRSAPGSQGKKGETLEP